MPTVVLQECTKHVPPLSLSGRLMYIDPKLNELTKLLYPKYKRDVKFNFIVQVKFYFLQQETSTFRGLTI